MKLTVTLLSSLAAAPVVLGAAISSAFPSVGPTTVPGVASSSLAPVASSSFGQVASSSFAPVASSSLGAVASSFTIVPISSATSGPGQTTTVLTIFPTGVCTTAGAPIETQRVTIPPGIPNAAESTFIPAPTVAPSPAFPSSAPTAGDDVLDVLVAEAIASSSIVFVSGPAAEPVASSSFGSGAVPSSFPSGVVSASPSFGFPSGTAAVSASPSFGLPSGTAVASSSPVPFPYENVETIFEIILLPPQCGVASSVPSGVVSVTVPAATAVATTFY
ncbi:hypothetical protein NLI96_g9871 [Meripilus lineatus]|uniref:Uncharacterized protein n=1 Tax=Meripilus lineatus TaxID=2056292 RepID=A0AAD5UUN6_9APHY|nr:hypothetical protein NLI96_g9871 [Physisporinus lineatus]